VFKNSAILPSCAQASGKKEELGFLVVCVPPEMGPLNRVKNSDHCGRLRRLSLTLRVIDNHVRTGL